MHLQQSIAPHFRRRESVKDIMTVLLIACGVLLVPAVVTHGFRAVVMALSGAVGAAAVEAAWQWFGNREQTVGDLTAVVTGIMCAMLMPAECPVYAPMLAAAFAVGAAKLPFGGPGRSVFCPAAAGGCFAVLCWADYRDSFPASKTSVLLESLPGKCYGYVQGILPVFANVSAEGQSIRSSVAPSVLLSGGLHNTVSSADAVAIAYDPRLSFSDFLFGGFNSAMGTGFAVLVIACGIFAALFGACAWQSSAAFVASVAVLSPLFRYSGIPGYQCPVYDIFTGAVLFSAFFLAGDIMTAPHMRSGRIIYGVCCGILTVILRRIGAVEYGELFAVMLMNPVSPEIDRLVWRARQKGFSLGASLGRLRRRLRKALHLGGGPFDSFDLDDDDEGPEVQNDTGV